MTETDMIETDRRSMRRNASAVSAMILPLAALLLLSACAEKKEPAAAPDASQKTETVMDNVDDLQGTIDDDMIAIDDIRTASPTVARDGPADAAGIPGGTGATGAAATDSGVSADGSPPADSAGSGNDDSE